MLTLTLAVLMIGLVARYGRAGLRRLAQVQLRAGWLPVLAVGAQLIAVLVEPLRWPALVATAVLIAAFCLANRRLGLLIAGAGAALNLLAMAANGGLMPIDPGLLERTYGVAVVADTQVGLSKNIARSDAEAPLAMLGDRFVLPGPLQSLAIWSIGDAILIGGVALTLHTIMRGRPHGGLRSAPVLEPS